MTKTPWFLAGCILLCSCAAARGHRNDIDLVLDNARVVDPVSRTIKLASVAIDDGRIVAIGRMPHREGATRRDLGGRFLIAGLVDAHTHSSANIAPSGTQRPVVSFIGSRRGAEVMLSAGITTFVDLFALEDSILALRDLLKGSGFSGAELLAAGPCFTAPNGHCTEYGIPTRTISNPEEARREIAAVAAKKPDVIKIVYDHSGYLPTIDKPTLAAAVEAAKSARLPSIVHVSTLADVEDAVDVGATAITHLPRRAPIPLRLAKVMAAKGIFYIPTMVTPLDAVVLARNPALRDDPLLNRTAEANIIGAYSDSTKFPAYLKSLMLNSDTIEHVYRQSIANLRDAGVRIVAGSDAGNFGVMLGWSLHRELARLVEMGLDPWDALASATINPGKMFGRKWCLHPGCEADLVVLDASPVDSIWNTTRILFVMSNGRIHEPKLPERQ